MSQTHSLTLQPIATVESPFKEKFGLPRQPGLIKSANARLKILPPFDQPDAFRGIEKASHLWLTFGFHEHYKKDWKALVRPPLLGGNEKIGVFATRSSFRPNALGLSVVALHRLANEDKGLFLDIACPDLIHGTPIYDIKPYVPYADAIVEAHFSLAQEAPPASLAVSFSANSLNQLQRHSQTHPELKQLIIECLSQDPRPAYRKGEKAREYGMQLYDLNIIWIAKDNEAEVVRLETLE